MTSLLLLLSLVFAQVPATAPPPAPASLSQAWDAEHRDYGPTPLLDHAALQPWLETTVKESGGGISIEEIGRSLEGRSISHLTVGRGPFHVLLWSQMHGDEPTATSALLDILHYVNRRRSSAEVQRLLDSLTLHIVPMLNPDGAQRFQRRNAQGIDINRDALLLQTPEGRVLKALRDRLNPALGFNLHNQNWRTSAGKSRKPASISLLAVAFDEARTETPGRVLAKKTCAVIRGALETFVPGQVARYDDEFEVRAFGDNVTKWGTPVVLIETGPLAGAQAERELVRLNFVAILASLDAIASGRVRQADPAAYESLPMNESEPLHDPREGRDDRDGHGHTNVPRRRRPHLQPGCPGLRRARPTPGRAGASHRGPGGPAGVRRAGDNRRCGPRARAEPGLEDRRHGDRAGLVGFSQRTGHRPGFGPRPRAAEGDREGNLQGGEDHPERDGARGEVGSVGKVATDHLAN